MLWNEGKVVNNNFTNLALPARSPGYNAIKACNSGTQVMIHTANADSMANARWFYDGIRAKGVQLGRHRAVVLLHLARHAVEPAQRHRRHEVPLRQAGRHRRDGVPVHQANADSRANVDRRLGAVLRLHRDLGRARRQHVHGRAEHGPQRRRRSASSTGNRPGTRSPATAGTRPTSTAPATTGTTWRSSTGPAS